MPKTYHAHLLILSLIGCNVQTITNDNCKGSIFTISQNEVSPLDCSLISISGDSAKWCCPKLSNEPAPDIGDMCSAADIVWNAPEVYSGSDGNGGYVLLCRNAIRSCDNNVIVQSVEVPAVNEDMLHQSCGNNGIYLCIVDANQIAHVECIVR